MLQDAEAYRERVIADAHGDAGRFTALLVEYHKAPRVTRDRLYIEAIEDVYSRTNKVLIDSEGGGNLLYLPLDQLMRQSRGAGSAGSQLPQIGAVSENQVDDSRARRTRE